ncbi:MAG: hypothetical protein RLZZ627_1254, partial [Pseudomonadota bacterium]
MYFKLSEMRGVQERGGDRGNQYTGGNVTKVTLAPTQTQYASELGVSRKTV